MCKIKLIKGRVIKGVWSKLIKKKGSVIKDKSKFGVGTKSVIRVCGWCVLCVFLG